MKILLPKLSLALLFFTSVASTHAEEQQYVTLSSTTSIENSGLLDYLIPKFKQKTGITVRVIASGTGRALLLGERGDADIVLVHHKTSEEKFGGGCPTHCHHRDKTGESEICAHGAADNVTLNGAWVGIDRMCCTRVRLTTRIEAQTRCARLRNNQDGGQARESLSHTALLTT